MTFFFLNLGIDAAKGGVKFLSFANSACHIELNVNRSQKMNVRVSINLNKYDIKIQDIFSFCNIIVPAKRRKGRPSTLQEEEEASSLDTQSGSRSDMKIPSSIYNTRTQTDAPAEVNYFVIKNLSIVT